MEQSLENIKIGDTVIFTTGGRYSRTIVAKVTRVTPKQFEVGAHRFWKKNGSMVGANFKQCRIATEKDIADLKMEKHRKSLREEIYKFFKYYDNVELLSVEEMEKIIEIIKDKIQG